MKSIKPGRGPSKISALTGVLIALFGVFWVILAIAGGAWFMAPFGIIFIAIALINAVYDYKNATGKERYSKYDIVDDFEEGDPLNRRYGTKSDDFDIQREAKTEGYLYCPYCGKRLNDDFEFCPYCGRRTK